MRLNEYFEIGLLLGAAIREYGNKAVQKWFVFLYVQRYKF